MPSPDDCSLKPPNFTPPLVSLDVELVCAVAFAPMPARNATPMRAASVRLRRRTGHLLLARRPPPTPDRFVEHAGETVRLPAQRDDRHCDTGEDESRLVGVLALDVGQ